MLHLCIFFKTFNSGIDHELKKTGMGILKLMSLAGAALLALVLAVGFIVGLPLIIIYKMMS